MEDVFWDDRGLFISLTSLGQVLLELMDLKK